MSEHDAHPMLEPIDYEIDPESAKSYLSGNQLKIYSLLWNAAFATYIEGPVIRKHSLSVCLTPKVNLYLKWSEMLESGWATYIPLECNENYRIIDGGMIPSFIPRYNENELSKINASTTIAFCVLEDNAIKTAIKKKIEKKIDYSNLILKMAEKKVSRPSTCASRLMLLEKNGLIEENSKIISLTQKSKHLLELISRKPSNERVNAELSFEIESAARSIERDQSIAAGSLDYFCRTLFNKPTGLADWLHNLKIQEETTGTDFVEPINTTISSAENSDITVDESTGNNKSLAKILDDELYEYRTQFKEHDWDDFTFIKNVLSIKFKGRLRTRKACKSKVSKEQVFKEHLFTFNSIIYIGFIRNIPGIDYVEEIEFSIMTDRTKGCLYLEELLIVYSSHYENHFGESAIDDAKKSISELFSELDLLGFYLLGHLDDGQLKISTRNDTM